MGGGNPGRDALTSCAAAIPDIHVGGRGTAASHYGAERVVRHSASTARRYIRATNIITGVKTRFIKGHTFQSSITGSIMSHAS